MVSSGGCIVGLKKTLVFSVGQPSEGIETNWVMHEYHLLDGSFKGSGGGTSSSSKRLQKKKSYSKTVRATIMFSYFILSVLCIDTKIKHMHDHYRSAIIG
jgi:hypothetical protein